MKKPTAKTQQEKAKIEQLSQAELVELVLGLQKIIQELQEKLAIATSKSRTTSQTSSQPPSLDLIQKSEKAKVEGEEDQKKKPGGQPGHQGKTRKGFERVAEAVKPAIDDLWGWATSRPNVHVDETPCLEKVLYLGKPQDRTFRWCVMGVKEWLWTASGEGFCLFHAADTRGRVELETMLGTEFAGVLSSDDFSVYNGCQVQAQQKCLAHLLRHFKKVLGLFPRGYFCPFL